MLEPTLATGGLDQNPPHRFSRGGEEVATAVPALKVICVHQPQISFVDQGRGLERLARASPGQSLGGQTCATRHRPAAGSCSAAEGSPCSIAEMMRITSFIALIRH